MSENKGVRLTTNLASIVIANTTTLLHTLGVGKRAIIRKIMWHNRTGGPGVLRVGYLTLAAAFVPVLPDIYMLNAMDGEMREEYIPICGNGPEGFVADTTAVTGSLGNISAQATVGGAAPADVQVTLEVEEI